ncbi:uncharacterized protein LOC113296013 [Papaver somniferum]|uniref:uncharacterized protein LOC113296013 n=1 Tax=Papaver somniferum TaxID=3469 RepID=UPI000E702977|nr:uncharacterized protein LOC113296013 [Papaver somniferum]
MWDSAYDLQLLKKIDLKCRKVKTTRIKEIFFQLPKPPHILRCYDGASRGNPGDAGYGFISRHWNGEYLFAISGGLGLATNFMAEVFAILCSGEWAINNNFFSVCFQTDSQAAMTAFQTGAVPWWAKTRWNKIKSCLQEWYFAHSYREKKFSADLMEKRDAGLAKGERKCYRTRPNFIRTLEILDKPYYRFC